MQRLILQMGAKRSYKTYMKEFIEGVVALVNDPSYSNPKVPKSLGIVSSNLCRWKSNNRIKY